MRSGYKPMQISFLLHLLGHSTRRTWIMSNVCNFDAPFGNRHPGGARPSMEIFGSTTFLEEISLYRPSIGFTAFGCEFMEIWAFFGGPLSANGISMLRQCKVDYTHLQLQQLFGNRHRLDSKLKLEFFGSKNNLEQILPY